MKDFAKEVLSSLDTASVATVLGLYGNLGAGKTTFTQNIASVLGISDSVLSPTFVIMKIYDLSGQKWKHLIHIDAYRIEDERELLNLGWQEMIQDPNNLILIEWPEKVSGCMPKHHKLIFNILNEDGREITYE